MSPKLINSETICDLQGRPLHPDSAILLKALDKLLTVGAYYSAEHEQYRQAAMKARDAIVGVIGDARRHVGIEITAQGLMIGQQNIDPHHRNVRLLHDLLVPLNIARLEIDGTLTPEDLRQALAALQHHKAALGQTVTFQEIVIAGLPSSVRAISCSVLRETKTGSTEVHVGEGTSLDELLGKWDESPDSAQSVAPVDESASLTHEFLDLVAQVLANLKVVAGESGIKTGDGPDGSFITVDDLVALRQAFERLIRTNPDPAELARLISQAQQALDLSRDAKSADIVFQLLRKNLPSKKPSTVSHQVHRSPAAEYKLTVAQLLDQVNELAADPAPIPEPRAGSCTNQLGICFQLLRSDPPRSLRTTLVATIEQIVAQPNFAELNLAIYAQAAISVVEQDDLSGIDDLLPLFTGILRQKHPELISLFWVRLVEAAAPEKLAVLWPHLVNDILLGLGGSSREITTRLAVAAGNLPLKSARTEGHRLEKQPALQGKSATRDLLVAPLPQIQTVLAVLLASPLRGWLGEELFHALRKQPLSRLVDLIISALGEHDPQNDGFYLVLIKHGQDEEPPADLREPAAAVLQSRLESLTAEQRQEEWVPLALDELSRLAPDQSRPLLERVRSEKRFFFFRAWPAAARTAADSALNPLPREVR